jgi:hypothetical protein
MRISTIVTVVLCLMASLSFAQKHSLEDVISARLSGNGAIFKDNVVTGYFAFYQYGKKSGGKKSYQLNILDQNLTPLSNKKFTSEDRLSAMEAAYNGDLIMVKFYNASERQYELKTYNEKAEQVSSKTIAAKKMVNMYQSKPGADDDGENVTIVPVEGQGFVHYAIRREGGAFSETFSEITFVPNDKTKKSWTWTTPDADRVYEYGDILGSDGKNIYAVVTKRTKVTSRDSEDFILAIDIATGKKAFEKSTEDKKHALFVLNGLIDLNGNLRINGLYFDKDAKPAKDGSLGMFSMEMTATGEVVNRSYQSWEKDVAKFLSVSDKGKSKDFGFIYFHKFIQTSDGKTFAIGENYKPNAGASVAASVLSGNLSLWYKIQDLYVFEFDPSFKLKDVKVFEKTSSSFETEAMAGPRLLGHYMKFLGAFDYSYTQLSGDKSTFNVGYIDYSREKGDRGNYFGAINYDGNKFTTDKIKFEKKSTWFQVYPAKPGHVMILEYYRKEQRLDMRIEKLNM